jgi:ABC-2 type transport system permease protein
VRLLIVHLRASTLELARLPSFSLPTLLFPALFFLAFGAPHAGRRADVYLASFAGFAVLGVAFFQFGVGIAAERASPWERYLRTLPVTARARFGARVLSALGFGLASAVLVAAVALATIDVHLTAIRWLELTAALAAGALPFALLGIAIGYWTSPRGALPLANILYLGLSFAGGLWTAGRDLPHVVARVSPYLPTRRFAEVLWGAAAGTPWRPAPWLWLGGYAAAFGALALWGYRRDEGERYA